MTSSQGVPSCYFRSRGPEMEQVYPLSRLRTGRRRYHQQERERSFQERVEHCSAGARQGRWWGSDGGAVWWSLSAWHVLVLLVVLCQSLTSLADVDRRQSTTPGIQLGTCCDQINSIIDLDRLHPANATRYTVSVADGWKVAWSPCMSFNLPADPHSGSADQCFHVAMCRYRTDNQSSVPGDYYTLGIHRNCTAVLTTPLPTPPVPDDRQSTPVNQQPASAPVVKSLRVGTTSKATDVTAGSAEENSTKADSSSTSAAVDDRSNLSTSQHHRLTSDSTRAATTTITPTAAAADDDDDDDDDNDDGNDDSDDTSDSDEKYYRFGDDTRVAAFVYHGIRSMRQHKSVVYVVCQRRRTAPSFLYLGSTDFEHYFELRICCTESDSSDSDSVYDDDAPANDTDDDSRSSESRRGRGEATVHGSAHYLWLLLLVTVLILVTSLVMAVFCCRRTGGSFVTSEPYSYMPDVTKMSRRRLDSTSSAPTKRTQTGYDSITGPEAEKLFQLSRATNSAA